MRDGAIASTSFEDPRRFLGRHGLRPKDSFGQCFLTAPHVAERIVDAVGAEPGDTVVEIGTGCGTLARMLAPRASRVLAIERDRDLVAALRTEPLPATVELIETDAASYDYDSVCARGPTRIVGNLPYQITGKILRALITPPVHWRCAVVMVQREVARRLLAAPGDDAWGVLGIFATNTCTVRKVLDAAPGCFHPTPRVHSMVVRLEPRESPTVSETPGFVTLVHALFAARRKTLRNGLANVPGLGRADADAALAAAGVDPGRRPETLTLVELGALATAVGVPPPAADGGDLPRNRRR